MKDWFKKNGWALLTFEILIVSILIYLEHRFLLFNGLYQNLSTKMGSNGDSYYNLAIFLQRGQGILNGNFYSLFADHYTWYPNILGMTAHNSVPSLVFIFFYKLFNNPILSYNLVFFGNLFLLQIGMYLLIIKYTNNKYIALFISLLTALSQGSLWNFFTGHIHAALIAPIPFATIFFENCLDKKITGKKLFFNFLGLFITLFVLYFSDWHIALFTSIWFGFLILIWFLSQLRNLKSFGKRILGVTMVFVVIGGLLTPLAYKYYKVSDYYNNIRTLEDVTGTNFDTVEYLGLRKPMLSVLRVVENSNLLGKYLDGVSTARESIIKSESAYPDSLSIWSFWVGLVIIIPTFILWLRNREKNEWNRIFTYLVIFLFCSILLLGPYPKIAGHTIREIKLPYYFLYKVFFPLALVRAVWRYASIGYLAILCFWGIILNLLLPKLRGFYFKSSGSSTKLIKIFGVMFLLVCAFVFILYQNEGNHREGDQAYEINNELFHLLDNIILTNESSDIFVWTENFEHSYFNYQLSLYNFKSEFQKANWVAGGIAGHYPEEVRFLQGELRNVYSFNYIGQLLAFERVDVVILDTNYTEEKFNLAKSVLNSLYSRKDNIDGYIIYSGINSEHLSEKTQIKHSISNSSEYIVSEDLSFYMNYYNDSESVGISTEDSPDNIRIDVLQDGEVFLSCKELTRSPKFLFPNTGYSTEVKCKNKLIVGEYDIQIYNDDKLVKECTISLVNHKQTESNSIAFDVIGNLSVPKYRPGIGLVPINFKVTILNSNNHKSLGFRVDYLDSNGVKYIFPGWLNQPECKVKGSFVEGNVIDYWCALFVPFDTKEYITEFEVYEIN